MPGGPVPGFSQTPSNRQRAHVEALRQLLINHGYIIPPHGGQIGGRMRSALFNYRSGNSHPRQWNRMHPRNDSHQLGPRGADVPDSTLIQHRLQQNKAHDPALNHPGGMDVPKANKPHGPAGGPHPTPKGPPVHPGTHHGGGGGGGNPANFMSMLTGLLGHSATAHSIPLSLADQIAAPDTAAAKATQSELDQLPSAKKAALKNILDWYGQVQGSEKTAAGRDQKIANQGADAMSSNTKGIMDSLGGSAMAGAGSIGSVGANDSNTLKALGANDAMLSSDLAPIFKLVSADASNKTQKQFGQGKIQLENALAAAQGQESQDRANAIMQILGSNNSARQTNFSNESGLLNTLAGLQISGMNAASQAQERQIMNALHMSEIQKNAQGKAGGLDAMTPSQRADFVQKIVSGLVDPNSHKLSLSWPQALRAARNTVRSAGLNPMDKQVINTIIGPALSNAGITAQGGGYWPAIYQP